MQELRVKVGVKGFKKKLLKIKLKWVGHAKRMSGEEMAKRADALDSERKKERIKTEIAMGGLRVQTPRHCGRGRGNKSKR